MAAIGDSAILTRDNYHTWSIEIKRVLDTEGLTLWIDKSQWPDLTSATVLDKLKCDQWKLRASGILKTYVSSDICPLISRLNDPAEIWDTLKEHFEVSGITSKINCFNDFYDAHILPDEDITSFLCRFEEVYAKVKDTGEQISDRHRCFRLIGHLPDEYQYLVREFKKLSDDKFNYDTIKADLLSEVASRESRERRKVETFEVSNSSKVENKVTPTELRCKFCRKRGHLSSNCCSKQKRKSLKSDKNDNSYLIELETIDCFSSEFLPPCWEWALDSASTAHVCQNKQFFTDIKAPPPGAIVRMGTTPHVVRGVGKVSFKVKEGKKFKTINLNNVMYVPNIHRNLISMSKMDKAGLHAKLDHGFKIFDKNWKYLYSAKLQNNFYILKAVKDSSKNHNAQVETGKDHTELSRVQSNFKKTPDPPKSPVKPVQRNLLTNNLARGTSPRTEAKTLISEVNQTVPEGTVKPEHKALKLNSSSVSLKVPDAVSKRKVNLHNENYNEAFALDRDNIMLWHERLGHSNINVIRRMVRSQLVEGCKELKGQEQKCEACIIAKNTRATYPRLPKIHSKAILDLIHSDVWGPSPVASRNGHRYLLTFIDDFSRRSFLYPMRSKDEVPSKISNFITFIERQTEKKAKVLRTDNGLEFCNQKVDLLVTKLGLKHERTSTYSPQQNGVAERFNRVLFEGVRTFSEAANLPAKLWVEAAMAVNYIRNRILHTGIDAVPFERWYGQKPSIRHLKRYGCVAFLHLPPQQRNKLQPRAKRGVLVGYGLSTPGYRIWFPKENKIVESKHVTFDEAQIGNYVPKKLTHNSIFQFEDDTITSTDLSVVKHDEPSTSVTPTLAEIKSETEEPVKGQDEVKQEAPEDDSESSSDESYQTMGEDEEDDQSQTFTRYITTRTKGATAGKQDIYILTPTGQRLRSNKALKKYCEDNNFIYDNTKANFSISNQYSGPIILKKIQEEANLTEIIIPQNSNQAKTLPQARQWADAMNLEIQTMLDRKVWTPVPHDPSQKVIGTRWVYTVKRDPSGKIHTYKARLVALGNNQREGLDYEETFSPVVNFSLVRLIFVIFSMILKWRHCLLDVKCAYLYGKIDKEMFIKQPADYVIPGMETHVLKLHKAIYGLHQAGRCWYNDLHTKLISNGFTEIPGITCIYSYQGKAIILVYVDDLPIFAVNEEVLREVICKIESLYQVKNLGEIHTLLGINFKTDENNIFYNINCQQYIQKCLSKFNATCFSRISLPASPGYVPLPRGDDEELPENLPFRSLLGCLQYISHRCRPDVAWTVHSLAQFTESPSHEHYRVLFRVLLYLSNSQELGLRLRQSELPLQFICYVDASWGNDMEDRKSWSGFIIFLNDMPVQWRITKQSCIALSPMEAEFISASEAAKEIKYLQHTLLQLSKTFPEFVPESHIQKPIMLCDNTAAISFTKNKADNVRNRHIDMKYKFIRDLYEQGVFDIKHVSSKENIADLLTKSLTKDQFLKFRASLLH